MLNSTETAWRIACLDATRDVHHGLLEHLDRRLLASPRDLDRQYCQVVVELVGVAPTADRRTQLLSVPSNGSARVAARVSTRPV